MKPLYALSAEYAALLELAEEGADVVAALAQLDGALEAKAFNVCRVIASLEADARVAADEARRLLARNKAHQNAADGLRRYLKSSMEVAGLRSIKSPQFSLTLQAGPPRVDVTDIDALPPELVRVKTLREADKVTILADYKRDGVVPPGCDIVQTTQLRVR